MQVALKLPNLKYLDLFYTMKEKNILVSGGSGNLGQVVVKRLLDEHYKLHVLFNPAKANQIPRHENISNIPLADLSNEEDVNKMMESLTTNDLQIYAGVFLAGGFMSGNIEETDGYVLSKMFKTNFETAYYICRQTFMRMQSQKQGGRIILIGGRPALEPDEGKKYLAYALSKSLIIQLAKILNEEGRNHNIVTSVIVPGNLDNANRKNNLDESSNKLVQPSEIADAIIEILSENSKLIREPLIKIYAFS